MQLYTYPSLNKIKWNPVEFDTVGNKFHLNFKPIHFSNGMSFNLYPFLYKPRDVSFNNRTGLFLTDLTKNKNILVEKEVPSQKRNLKSIRTFISDWNGYVYKHYSLYNLLSGLEVRPTDTLAFTETPQDYVFSNFLDSIEDELTFYFEDSYVYVEDHFGKVLTNGGLGEGQTYFSSKIMPLTEYQKWDYVLGDGLICLFAYNTNYKLILTQNNNKRLVLSQYASLTSNNVGLPTQSILQLQSYSKSFNKFDSLVDSYTVKYDASTLNNEEDLIPIKNSNNFLQNYLGVLPYENIKSNGKHDFYFHSLKNYQTYDYKYNNKSDQINRQYYRIFSGSNQNKGLNKIYLNYTSDKTLLEFPSDKYTEFYLSSLNNNIPLSSAGFIENGAFAGKYPYISDRIVTKKDNKLAEIPELQEIIKPAFNKPYKYLCSWLYSPNSTENSAIWYDRYYNAATYSQNEALTATKMLYKDFVDSTKAIIYDVPSEIKLQPGVLYQYYHAGNNTSVKYLEDLNHSLNNQNQIINANVLNITSWNNTLYDDSYYKNNGLTFGNSGNFFGDYWKLDGTNYGIIQANNSVLPEENLTVSLWLNFDNWENVEAYQIFGNFYNSGFGLFNESKPISPLFTIIENKSKETYNFNVNFNQASIFTGLIEGDIVQRMPDLSYWVFDSNNKRCVKYDINNSVESINPETGEIGAIPLPLTSIDQVETDSQQNLFIYDNKTKYCSILDKEGRLLSTVFVSGSSNRIEIIERQDPLVTSLLPDQKIVKDIIGNCSVVDNNDNVWQVIGPNLYKGKRIIGTVGASNLLTCDIYNNIWVIGEDDSYTKVDQDGNFVFRYSFNKAPLINQTNCPPSPPPEPPVVKYLEEDLPFLSTNDFKYILTIPDYYTILVTPPLPKLKPPVVPITKRRRAVNFLNGPQYPIFNENLTSICGLSSIQTDKLVMVDLIDNEAYIINQLGQLELKLNLEIFYKNSTKLDFRTGGDFTGYQHNRKFSRNENFSRFSWKTQIAYYDTNGNKVSSNTITLFEDLGKISKGWHHFCLVLRGNTENSLRFYIDGQEVDFRSTLVSITPTSLKPKIDYVYRTSLIIGANTVKNTLLNNFLNIPEGYKMIGSIGDLKMYNIGLDANDVKHLYYSSKFAPRRENLLWNMPTGDRNYIEEIEEWFRFQMPASKSKFYNINIHNLNVNDEIKQNIELAVKNIITKINPAYSSLNKINWVNETKPIKNNPVPNSKGSIRKVGRDSIYVGFGASTSTRTNEHWIHDFTFKSIYDKIQMYQLLTNSNFIGNAKILGESIKLTDNVKYQKGNVFYKIPVFIEDDFENLINWEVYFRSSMGGGGSLKGDGLSFIIQSKSNIGGLDGYNLGYGGIPNSLAVGYDTFLNAGIDPNGNHIEIDTYDSNNNLISLSIAEQLPFDLCGTNGTNKFLHNWIEYSNFSLNVYISLDFNSKPSTPLISFPVDIRKYISE